MYSEEERHARYIAGLRQAHRSAPDTATHIWLNDFILREDRAFRERVPEGFEAVHDDDSLPSDRAAADARWAERFKRGEAA